MSNAEDLAEPDAQERTDPYRRHRFVVEADGLPESGFAEINGLEAAVANQSEYSTGDADKRRWWGWRNLLDRFIDRRPRYRRHETTSPNLELWRGVTDELVLWNWLQDWIDGRIEPRTVRVYLLDGDGEATVGWACTAATPIEWTGPRLEADKPGIAMEKLELAHDGISATADASCDTAETAEPGSRPDTREPGRTDPDGSA